MEWSNQALESYCVEVKVQILALYFTLFCFLFIYFIALICLYQFRTVLGSFLKHDKLLDFLFCLFLCCLLGLSFLLCMHTHALCMRMHT